MNTTQIPRIVNRNESLHRVAQTCQGILQHRKTYPYQIAVNEKLMPGYVPFYSGSKEAA